MPAPSAAAVLASLGYEPAGHITGELLNYQGIFIKWRDGKKSHVVDVHWRVANPQVFAGLLSYEELASDAAPIPALGPGARGIASPAALLLACVHRVAHHFDSDRLIWLYDIHLIASTLTTAEWTQFVDLAVDRRVAAICWRSLDLAREKFGTAIPVDVSSGCSVTRAGGRGHGRLPHTRSDTASERRQRPAGPDDVA